MKKFLVLSLVLIALIAAVSGISANAATAPELDDYVIIVDINPTSKLKPKLITNSSDTRDLQPDATINGKSGYFTATWSNTASFYPNNGKLLLKLAAFPAFDGEAYLSVAVDYFHFYIASNADESAAGDGVVMLVLENKDTGEAAYVLPDEYWYHDTGVPVSSSGVDNTVLEELQIFKLSEYPNISNYTVVGALIEPYGMASTVSGAFRLVEIDVLGLENPAFQKGDIRTVLKVLFNFDISSAIANSPICQNGSPDFSIPATDSANSPVCQDGCPDFAVNNSATSNSPICQDGVPDFAYGPAVTLFPQP